MRRGITFLITLGLGALPAVAHADGDETLGPSYNETLVGGGVAVAGAGLAARADGVTNPTETIDLLQIPVGATVHTAWLYWSVWGGSGDDSAALDGMAVTGTLIGTSADTLWGGNSSRLRAYRADVTSLIAGNGTFEVSGLSSSAINADANGAGLVVVYEQSSASHRANIVVNDGAITWCGAAVSNSFDALAIPEIPTLAAFGLVVGDGQSLNDPVLSFEGAALAPLLDGAFGSMWDMEVLDVTPAVQLGQTRATWALDASGQDCLHLVAAFLETRFPAFPMGEDVGPGDVGGVMDVGPQDVGDASFDLGAVDGSFDAGSDVGPAFDVGVPDVSHADASAAIDARPAHDADAFTDRTDPSGPKATASQGCCSTADGRTEAPLLLLFLFGFLALGRRVTGRIDAAGAAAASGRSADAEHSNRPLR